MESCGDVDDFQEWPVMGETSFWPGARRGFFASHKRPLSNSPSLRSRGLPTNGICDPPRPTTPNAGGHKISRQHPPPVRNTGLHEHDARRTAEPAVAFFR